VHEVSVADELAVRRILAEYCHFVDDAEFADLVDLFSPDGELVYGSVAARGPDELLTFFADRQGRPEQRGKHLTMNTVVDVRGDTAVARSDYVHVMPAGGELVPVRAGRYRDELVRLDGRWRLRRREILPWPPPDA
jgi:hypothetical protein